MYASILLTISNCRNRKSNSLVDLAFPIVQKLNFVTVAHCPSWHFSDFKHAQQILSDEFRVPLAIFITLCRRLITLQNINQATTVQNATRQWCVRSSDPF